MKCSALLSFCVLASAATAAPSFLSEYENDGVKSLKNNRGGNNIVDRLREDKRFSRFVEVLEKERGLRDELENGDKETTVFAPTNTAFKHIEDQWALNRDENRPEMRDILRYHIAGNSEITGDCLHAGALIPTNLRLKSLEDRHQRVRVFRFHNEVWLNMHSRIVEKDIEADNGRIHAIDRVMMPPQSVPEMLYTIPTTFSTFSAALERTGMNREVCREKGITAFVPSNQAWENLGFENLKYLFSCAGQKTSGGSESGSSWDAIFSEKGENRVSCRGTKDLKKILEHHIATELAYSTDMMKKEQMKMKTLGDQQITVCARTQGRGEDRENRRDEDEDKHRDVRRYNFVLNNGEARVQFTDGLANNGAIQMIDNVMIPSDVKLPHDKWMMV